MLQYLFKLLILLVFSLVIIYFYYFAYPVHNLNFDWYSSYIVILLVVFWIYKYFQVLYSWSKIYFSPLKIFLYFLLNLFILCIIFFSINTQPIVWWIILFFKIIYFSFFPLITTFILLSFWRKILSYIDSFKHETPIFKFLIPLWFWFFSFLFLVSLFWILWFYNIYIILLILLIFLIFWFNEFKSNIKWISDFKFELDNHHLESDNLFDKISLKLLSTEFLFIVATLILSVNLINIVRPFPIWWDDLWAYMNYPKLFSSAWEISFLSGMNAWQTFTWIWFLMWSSTQAFFLNNLGWILSFIVFGLILSEVLKTQKKTFINIPLLISTVFISMPMVIFQQAKDMKLDLWLFFISIIIVYLFYYLYHSSQSEILLKSKKDRIIYFLIIWLLLWFAFSIKFTSLILISAIIWILFYVRLWKLGFIWYIFTYFWLFTYLWLWEYMNVALPNDSSFVNMFSFLFFLIWFSFLFNTFLKNKKIMKVFLLKILFIFLWVLIWLLPWIWKNIYTSYPELSFWKLLSWTQEFYEVNYLNIYNNNQLEVIENNYKNQIWVTSSWVTSNEDFWRYFWYEEWINNYIKLPWNLTMQKNQWWEFTWITFIFLAFLPAILLFLPYRKNYFKLWIVSLLLFETLLFVVPSTSAYLTEIFSKFTLPYWYIIIFLFFIIWLLLNYSLKNKPLINLFKINLVFTLFYTFLWAISAFWIVWYWITMYFWFLLMIAIWIYYMSSYWKNANSKEFTIKFFWSFVLLFIFWIHFFFSVLPHNFTNLKTAWYANYKTWEITENEGIFIYHPEYLNILFELNIKDEKKTEFIFSNIDSDMIKNIIKWNNLQYNIKSVEGLLKQIYSSDANQFDSLTRKSARRSLLSIYKNIVNPKNEYKSDSIIYRLWTFLRYFITENNVRLFEDSLITEFDKYIYNSWSVDKTVQNMKDLWLSYLLVDLNSATIDKDPRHDLTRRYENLLFTFTSDKLELIETDSICLKIALEEYKLSDKWEDAKKEFMVLWGVNYESYLTWWLVINRNQKWSNCFKYIHQLIIENKINESNYSYLLWFKQFLEQNNITANDQIIAYMNRFFNQWFKALFKIN